jgi:hypothetical protein
MTITELAQRYNVTVPSISRTCRGIKPPYENPYKKRMERYTDALDKRALEIYDNMLNGGFDRYFAKVIALDDMKLRAKHANKRGNQQ